MKIKVLSEETINKIAAGEVVERPASVVKELVENSIDAGASQIDIDVKDGGKKLIRITDNGCGMDKDDAVLAFSRHATSKINTADDLFKIFTLGFRGEALPSIAGISHVELITCEKDTESAVRICIEGGKLLEVKESGAPLGTMISVKNLFFNTPARRKFLKTNTTELTHIVNVVSSYVLIYSDFNGSMNGDKLPLTLPSPQRGEGRGEGGCGFKLTSNDESIIEIFPKDELLDRIKVLYGNEVAEGLVKLDFEQDGIKASGYTGTPVVTHSNRSNQLVFVNKRPVVNRAISYGIYEAYLSLIPKGRFPAVFMFLEINPEVVDVNVHPSKKEVRFSDDRVVQRVVKESILNALNITPAQTGLPQNVGTVQAGWRGSGGTGQSDYAKPDFMYVPQYGQKETCSLQEPVYGQYNVDGFKIKQMLNSYIINETDDGFEIIDQHAVHERILYERIKSSLTKKEQNGQRLLMPVNVELTPAEDEIFKKQLALFNDIGFSIEEFGQRTFIIDTIPSYMDKVDVVSFIRDVLSEIKENEKAVSQNDIKDGIIKLMACRAAVKQGDKLDVLEMQKLLKDWRDLKFPYTCPHGRPAVIKMTKKELDKKFQRS